MRCLYYDGRIYDTHCRDRTAYEESVLRKIRDYKYRWSLPEEPETIIETTALDQGHKEYVKRLKSQQKAYDKDADLNCLLDVLPRMPMLRYFGIHCKDDSIKDLELGHLDPYRVSDLEHRAPSQESDTALQRGFSVMTRAISISQVDARAFDTSHLHGVSHQVLSMTALDLYHTYSTFRNLTSLRMSFFHAGQSPGNSTARLGNLAKIICAAQHLEILDLGLWEAEDMEHPLLLELIGEFTWQHLRKVSFSSFGVSKSQLLEFLRRHQHSLRYLHLCFVDCSGLAKLFEEIAGLPIAWGSLLIQNVYSRKTEPEEKIDKFFGSNPTRIHKYLQAGGSYEKMRSLATPEFPDGCVEEYGNNPTRGISDEEWDTLWNVFGD